MDGYEWMDGCSHKCLHSAELESRYLPSGDFSSILGEMSGFRGKCVPTTITVQYAQLGAYKAFVNGHVSDRLWANHEPRSLPLCNYTGPL
eukprot:gene7909-699_t